jgi:hypothetical protein
MNEAVGKLRDDEKLESKCYMMRGKNYFGVILNARYC